jgi:hypothetical protein
MILSNDSSFPGASRPHVKDALDIDDVRDRIWDYLFRTKSTHPVDEIAALVECDDATVRTAINHEWFRVADDRVSIAYVAADAPRVTRP